MRLAGGGGRGGRLQPFQERYCPCSPAECPLGGRTSGLQGESAWTGREKGCSVSSARKGRASSSGRNRGTPTVQRGVEEAVARDGPLAESGCGLGGQTPDCPMAGGRPPSGNAPHRWARPARRQCVGELDPAEAAAFLRLRPSARPPSARQETDNAVPAPLAVRAAPERPRRARPPSPARRSDGVVPTSLDGGALPSPPGSASLTVREEPLTNYAPLRWRLKRRPQTPSSLPHRQAERDSP